MNKLKILIFLLVCPYNIDSQVKRYKDLVPNKETAIKIAEVILPVYFGQQVYALDTPLIAELQGDTVWMVTGPLRKKIPQDSNTIVIYDGGGPYVYIRKSDCKVLKIFHTK